MFMNFTILRFNSIDSTNLEALKQARLGVDEGTCIIARQQTAGRGRRGRTWVSPMDAGFYCSIVLRPDLEAYRLPLITLAIAVAVYDTLVELGLKPDIKWPNDVLVREKKICGILAETTETAVGIAVIAGIGINLNSRNFHEDIADTATSVADELKSPVTFSTLVTSLEETLLKLVAYWHELLQEPEGDRSVLQAWTSRSTYAHNKPVRVTLSDASITGKTDGLEPNGSLRVISADGSVHVIQAGDVERLREGFD